MPSSRPLPLPRRSNPWRGRALALACGLAACGDDASPAESRDAQVDASAPNDGGSSAQDAADRSGDAAVGAHDASHHGDAASEPVDAAQGADAEAHDAGRDASAQDASPACVTFARAWPRTARTRCFKTLPRGVREPSTLGSRLPPSDVRARARSARQRPLHPRHGHRAVLGPLSPAPHHEAPSRRVWPAGIAPRARSRQCARAHPR